MMYESRSRNKVLILLRTSKTHGIGDNPQSMKISGNNADPCDRNACYCPVKLPHTHAKLHHSKAAAHNRGPLFIFSDGSPVRPYHYRLVLKCAIKMAGLDQNNYDCHSLRIGRSCDLFRDKMPVEDIKKLGRWKSNSVFDYLDQC